MRSAHALGPESHAGRQERRQTGPPSALLACASCVAVLTRALAVSRLSVNPSLDTQLRQALPVLRVQAV